MDELNAVFDNRPSREADQSTGTTSWCWPRWGERPGKSLPTTFQDWANTRAAYRFFSNGKVVEDRFLAGPFQASALRVGATDGPILVLQDTTEFSFTRTSPEENGFTKTSTGRKEKDGRFRQHDSARPLSMGRKGCEQVEGSYSIAVQAPRFLAVVQKALR